MATKVTFLGHGTFEVATAGKTIIIDPFLTDNPAASTTADAVSPDAIIVTHGYGRDRQTHGSVGDCEL